MTTRLAIALLLLPALPAFAADVFVEAEAFEEHGGWKLDTQFVGEMGSPYLLAHGLGRPVEDATTTVEFPEVGTYRVFVRTKDWVARWKAPGTPGRFEVLVDGKPLGETFGTKGAEWFWHDGGTVEITKKSVSLALNDLTGFDGRCDAIWFTTGDEAPPNEGAILPNWRKQALGLPEEPIEESGYDLVVVGGGYSGMGAALSAARMGCKVALIQNRGVLGGNGSSEVRVWAMGNIRRGKYPRIGEIVEEFADNAKKSPGTYEEFGDAKKEKIVRDEPRIDLFLHHHAYKVESTGPTKEEERKAELEGKTASRTIQAVHAFDTRTGAIKRFTGTLFCDATGHGTIGHLAEADWDMTEKGRMGMSNMWAWAEGEEQVEFPRTPWALDLDMPDFPYPRDHHGQWFWESGFDKDAIGDAEGIRDWNLRAVYGAFNAMKNRGGAAKHRTAYLTWIAYIGGPRESRRLLGDVILTEEDIVTKKDFKDGCVPSTWSIDLHYPKKQFAKKFPDNPFISIAVHDRRVDRNYGYPVPYRCFYSRNVDNLFMAGRCISVTHKALGTVRVMKTCGMMGEVVGKAAYVCTDRDCSPREVYENYWAEMDELLKLPGKARRVDIADASVVIPDDVPDLPPGYGPPTGLDPKKLAGVVVDDRDAKKTGGWTEGNGLKGYVGYGYLYAGARSNATITFELKAEKPGKYEVRLAYQPHENRASNAAVLLKSGEVETSAEIDMRAKPPVDDGFVSVGTFDLSAGETVSVTLSSKGANGFVHADAAQLVPTSAGANE